MAKIFNVKSGKQNLFLPILKANRYLSMSGTSKRDSPDINCWANEIKHIWDVITTVSVKQI